MNLKPLVLPFFLLLVSCVGGSALILVLGEKELWRIIGSAIFILGGTQSLLLLIKTWKSGRNNAQ
jgi:hypothetical protein